MGGEELALPAAECLCADATGSEDWTSETSKSILRVKGSSFSQDRPGFEFWLSYILTIYNLRQSISFTELQFPHL